MMTAAGGRILAAMLGEALDRGTVRVEGTGTRLVLTATGQAVLPQLRYEVVRAAAVAPGAGIRPGASTEDDTMTTSYASLPAERLVRKDQR
jgi:hypothetical protein